MLFRRDQSVLLLIDMQEQLVPAIRNGNACVRTAERLLKVARLLKIPVIATEHMPAKIGRTVESLRAGLEPGEIIEKTTFSALRHPGLKSRLQSLVPRSRIVVAGTEAHVCVMQTALELAAQDFHVAIAEDAVGSRFTGDKTSALNRMRAAGLTIATAETAMFEWLERGDAPETRDVIGIVKER